MEIIDCTTTTGQVRQLTSSNAKAWRASWEFSDDAVAAAARASPAARDSWAKADRRCRALLVVVHFQSAYIGAARLRRRRVAVHQISPARVHWALSSPRRRCAQRRTESNPQSPWRIRRFVALRGDWIRTDCKTTEEKAQNDVGIQR